MAARSKTEIHVPHRSGGSFITAPPERSSSLGLLSSLLRLPPLLASPLLASWLLVWRVLASGLLVPWSDHGRRRPELEMGYWIKSNGTKSLQLEK
jgi:hypothetical protein